MLPRYYVNTNVIYTYAKTLIPIGDDYLEPTKSPIITRLVAYAVKHLGTPQ